MNLGHERARCIDGPEVERAASSWTAGETPCALNTTSAPSGTLSDLNEHCAAILERLHNMSVVNDLFAYVDGAPYVDAFSTVTTALSTSGAITTRVTPAGQSWAVPLQRVVSPDVIPIEALMGPC